MAEYIEYGRDANVKIAREAEKTTDVELNLTLKFLALSERFDNTHTDHVRNDMNQLLEEIQVVVANFTARKDRERG